MLSSDAAQNVVTIENSYVGSNLLNGSDCEQNKAGTAKTN